jgi:hypothetical protein
MEHPWLVLVLASDRGILTSAYISAALRDINGNRDHNRFHVRSPRRQAIMELASR